MQTDVDALTAAAAVVVAFGVAAAFWLGVVANFRSPEIDSRPR